MEKKVCLVILDGWGIGKGDNSDAIHQAETPFFDSLLQKYPNAELLTDGNNVGLPKGQMGNSEVGHMNIGAGRIVYQDLVRINKSIESGEFFSHPLLLEKFQKAKSTQKKVHFMGLLGEGGVHASQQHLVALCKLAHEQGLENVYIHGFTDGRDTDPRQACGCRRWRRSRSHRPAAREASWKDR